MKNFLIILLPAFFWASSDIITRIYSNKMNAVLGVWFLAVGMVLVLSITAFLTIPSLSKEISLIHSKNALMLLLSGVVNSVGFFFFIRFLQEGGNFTQGMPLILVFLSVFIVIYGIIFFKDPLTIKTGIGILCAIGAIYFLS